MKNKYLRCFITVFALLCLVCGGCKHISYPFFNDVAEIETIEIVEVSNSLVYEDLKIRKLFTIEEKEKFIEEFMRIEVAPIFGYAYAVNENEPYNQYVLAVKFEYINGDFELLAVPGPGRAIYSVEEYWGKEDESYMGDKYYNGIAGTISLDKEQWLLLVNKYYKTTK